MEAVVKNIFKINSKLFMLSALFVLFATSSFAAEIVSGGGVSPVFQLIGRKAADAVANVSKICFNFIMYCF